jgi:RNA polymerase sigma-70 factor (ECF subfamily)
LASEGSLASPPRDATLPLQNVDFGVIYVEHFEVAWRALRRYGVPSEELEDALQEVFLTVHDRLPTFRGHSSLRTWIYGIARRVARNHRPKGQLEIRDPIVMDGLPGTAGTELDQSENARVLYSLLAELSTERREILVLVELEQMTVSEAAEVLGENPHTLQSRLRVAKTDLLHAWTRRLASDEWRRTCAQMNQR